MNPNVAIALILFSTLNLLNAQDLTSRIQTMLRKSGVEGLSEAIQNKNINWPRLTPSSENATLALITFDALIQTASWGNLSEERSLLYASLARTFFRVDGWSNRILADTATRLALDDALRLSFSTTVSVGFWKKLQKTLPEQMLRSSDRIDDLLRKDVVTQLQPQDSATSNLVLNDLNIKSVDELWFREAVLHLTARELFSKPDATAFAARLAQTEIVLKCLIPLLEIYLDRGGDIKQLKSSQWQNYQRMMRPVPKFQCEWMTNKNVNLSQLAILVAPYRTPESPNIILRELVKVRK
jgi:hypothetical protein